MEKIKLNLALESEAGLLYKRYCEENNIECRITAAANFCLGYMVVKESGTTGARWVKCWERKPDMQKVRFKDKHGNEFIGNYSVETGQYWAYGLGQAINDVIYWRPQDESATSPAAREEDWISVEDRPLIRRDGEFWELTEDGEKEFIVAVPYLDAATDEPKKERWWIRHCYIDGEGFLYVKCDLDTDESVAGWAVSDIIYWRPLPAPPKRKPSHP